MDKDNAAIIEAYRKRRQQRLDAKRDALLKTIEAYKQRRRDRLDARGYSFAEKLAINTKKSNNDASATDADYSRLYGKKILTLDGKNVTMNTDANPDGTQWVTLENGRRIFIDKDGNILKGQGSGGNVKDLGEKYEELENEAKTYATSERPVTNDPTETGITEEENERRWSTFRQEVESAIMAGNFEGVQLAGSEEQVGYWGEQERSVTFSVEYDTPNDLMNFAKNIQDTYQQDAVMVLSDGQGATLQTTRINSKDAAIDLLQEAKVKFATIYDDRVEIVHSDPKEEYAAEAFADLAKKRGISMRTDSKEVSQVFAEYGDSAPVEESERPRPQYPDDRK